jgi:hypothetical protein
MAAFPFLCVPPAEKNSNRHDAKVAKDWIPECSASKTPEPVPEVFGNSVYFPESTNPVLAVLAPWRFMVFGLGLAA